MARTRSTPKKTTGGKGASALLKASGKGKSARATKSAYTAAPITSPVKSPKKKLMRKQQDLRDADQKERKKQGLTPRTWEDHLEIAKEDLAGKGELEHCKSDPTRRAQRCALYKSGSHKCEPIPNLIKPLIQVLKKAILDDKESRISNARVAICLQLDTLYDSETAGFYSAQDKATKPLIMISKAAEQALEEGFKEEGAGDGGNSSAKQKVTACKIIKTLSALL
ncbi:hypothetical protein Forpe1208_v008348 [Fusarium oxysporum f. sp. rapae]|uniref:Uncharacterized protein n=1 Tax=Fusarium oxysporum f. sp. rapae TaxID=485398 RepID=A0A8J5P7S0_FUSOX|nr:hypothetical protein Forpe1208_v008348 [Fusarium oxysporum f. sp. rapae]